MLGHVPDIDIDVRPSTDRTELRGLGVPASAVMNGELTQHPCGVYFQHIPVDEVTGLSAIPYKTAEQLGYFKIDFLSLHLLENVASKQELIRLASTEPDWDLLTHESIVSQLFHISKHYDTVRTVCPRSLADLADVLALIRPSKRHLLSKYVAATDKTQIRRELYAAPFNKEYYFKKSHAYAYATNIIIQLNLLNTTLKETQ